MKSLNGPIPGQSLTNEPRNAPWERPPETSDPDEAVVHHLTRISEPKRLNSILDGVGAGFPVSLITDLMLTGAVSQGIHSIDVSMMIAPVIHDYITNLLEEEGVEFKEFFDEDGDESARDTIAISGALQGLQGGSGLEVKEEPTMPQEPDVEEEPMEEPRGGGLMSRKEV